MNRRDALAAGLLFLGLVALLLPLAAIGVDAHHDGIMLKPALDVLAGQTLFRDSFTQYGALTTYLQALALWIEPTLLSLRLLNVAAFAVSLAFLYAAWRIILPRSLAVMAGVVFILFVPAYGKNHFVDEYWMLLPWSSVFAMMFQAIGVYALLRMIVGREPLRWGTVLGVACACTFWCRQPVGLAMLGSLVVIWPALHWTGWTPVTATKRAVFARLAGGFFLVNVILFGGLLLNGALPAWWDQNIAWPARWSQGFYWTGLLPLVFHPIATAGIVGLCLALALPGFVRRFRPQLSAWFTVFYFVCLAGFVAWHRAWFLSVLSVQWGGWHGFIILALGLQACLSIRAAFGGPTASRPPEYHAVAALGAVTLGSLLQYYPMPDVWHGLYALSCGFGLLVFSLWRWSGWRPGVLVALLAVVFLPSLRWKLLAIQPALSQPLVTLDRPALLRGMRVPAEQAASLHRIADVVDLIKRHQPDISSAMIGHDALYLCFTDNRTNPTPYYVTWEKLAGPEESARRWRHIQEVRPLLVLHKARWDAVNDFYRRGRYVPLLYLPVEAVEIAVPQELADAMNVKAYGLSPPVGSPPAGVQP